MFKTSSCPECLASFSSNVPNKKYCSVTCSLAAYKNARLANPNKHREYYSQWRYGIKPEDLRALYEKQNKSCAVCFVSEEQLLRDGFKRLSIDHDHETGVIRGLLCNNCNRGIGLLRDDPEILVRALNYLKGMS